ncbi:MAG TPA: hypothetical protein VGZ73_08030, partial [Bryobacteraceae bacterium]|nr:hypothetical protein [Bryobacteraceae bacterium]
RLWGLATPTGFDPFLPRQYKEVIEHWVPFRTNRLFDLDPHDDKMLQSLGVRFALVLTGTPSDELLAGNRNFSLVGSKDIFCHVYEYLRATPPYRWESAEGGTATPTEWIPERREFGVRSERGGRFVLVEQFFPGWRAKVDGREARIDRWGGAFQAIAVGPGSHRVAFEYRPRSWWIGVGLSVVAVTVLALPVLARLRSSARGPWPTHIAG